MNKDEFYTELKELETRFENMNPEFELTLRDPEQGVEGYIVVWNTGISVGGPLERCGKGGTRITPDVSLDEVKMLARRMALKNAAAGLPLGGAKSGIKAAPDAEGFEDIYKRFAVLSKPSLFEHGGPFGGFGFDIGARPIHPQWVCDALESTQSFTGKPVEMGGTDYDKEGIAGLGVATSAKTALEEGGKSADGATFAVQGIGAMGGAVIKYFTEYGGLLSAVSDPRLGGTWYFDDAGAPEEFLNLLLAVDIDGCKTYLDGSSYKNTEDNNDALYHDVDVVFPCAVHDVLTKYNTHKVQAKYLSEGANGPCTIEAHEILYNNGTTVIPDFIANSGGIIAAFVELTSKATIEDNIRSRTKATEAKITTINKITENVQQLMRLIKELDVEPTHAGMYIALRNIFGLHDAPEHCALQQSAL